MEKKKRPKSRDSRPESATKPEIEKINLLIQVPEALPDGAVPLFLSTATVELFAMKARCTEAEPYTFISKSDMLADLFNRAAISDFHPIKAQLHELTMDRVMIIWDIEWKFGQNYVACLTESSMQAFQKQVIEKVEVIEETTRIKWVCQGTDKEMEMEKLRDPREKLHFLFSRKRRKFGQETKFEDNDCQLIYVDIKPMPLAPGSMIRLQQSNQNQAIESTKTNSAQTTWFRKLNQSTQYEARKMNEKDCRRILEVSEPLRELCSSTEKVFSKALIENTLIDYFQNDFDCFGEEDTAFVQGTNTSLQEYQSFTDLLYSKDKTISCACWHPTQRGVLAVSCVQRSTLDERLGHGFSIKSKQSLILIWSFYDPIHPQLILESSDDVMSFAFHPQLNLIVGGCINGQIVLWDISDFQDKMNNETKKEEKTAVIDFIRVCAVSCIEYSHRAAITDVRWNLMSVDNNGNFQKTESVFQVFSVGLDGTIMVWDLRYKKDVKSLDKLWRPIFKAVVQTMDCAFEYGLMRFDPGQSTTFWAATEDGDVIKGDWSLDSKQETPNSLTTFASRVHYGMVSDICRCPFFNDVILSIGGWSLHVWKESSVPLLSSSLCKAHYTCGSWSPTRPSVFFVGRSDGVLEIWDILDKSHQPSHSQSVSAASISAISIQTYMNNSAKSRIAHQFVAIGDDDGTAHILEAPRNISRPSSNEKSFMSAFLDREVKRIQFAIERKQFREQERKRKTEPAQVDVLKN